MPDTMSQTAAAPLVTFLPPPKMPGLLEQIRIARTNGMATIPVGAYRELFFPFAKNNRGVVLSDPAGLKRVLLDNVANYPKTPTDAPFLSAAFGEGLLTLAGERWKSHRRLMSPSFDHRSIVSYAPGMVEATRRFVEAWDQRGPSAEIDIAEAMTELTLRIITRAMFSSDSGGITELFGKTFNQGLAEMEFGLLDILPLIGPMHVKNRIARIKRVFSRLDSAIYQLIDERAQAGAEEKPDLLGRLLLAREADTGEGLSRQEIRDEMVIIFIAGHETTAVAMTFAFYILAQRPQVEAKLHDELDRVLAGRMPDYDDLANLPYTRQVLDETMRLYPPAPGLSGRQAQAEDEICGQKIPKGAEIFVAPWIIHHHEKLWENPYEFDPERFTADKVKARPRFAHMPFGGGPRVCIGASLAMTEACLILATIAQRYRLELVSGQDISIRSRITLRAHPGIRMRLSRRAN